jgi:Family of unknown function (DUF6011)
MATVKILVIDDSSMNPAPSVLAAAIEAMSGAVEVECDPTVPGPVVGGIVTDGDKVSHPEAYPDLSRLTTKKVAHKEMILDGVCTNCACCGQPLTDSVSVQRGLGPRCSRKGYSEDPVDCEEMDAFICLAEFQELVEFLTEHYKPLGARGLVNGLVRVASLNRPRGGEQKEGNEKLFKACCDAVEALGYPKMANLLRDTLVVAWLNKSDQPGEDGISYLRTKAYRTPGWLWSEVMEKVGGVSWDKKARTYRIPMHEKGSPVIFCSSRDSGKSNKRVVWELLLKAFEGQAAKIDGHAVPIRVRERTAA